MNQLDSDSSFHYIIKNNKLSGLSGTYVDDLLRAGNADFKKLSEQTGKHFDMKEPTSLPCEFSGFRLNFNDDAIMVQTQTHYTNKLFNLEIDATFTMFLSMRMHLAWLSHTRPDCLFEISRMAQITEDTFNSTKPTGVKTLNAATRYASKH